MVVSCVALFLVLAGTALAVPRNSIRSPQIVNGAVKAVDLGRNAVRSGKIANGTVTAADLRANSVRSEEILDASVGEDELADDAVGGAKLATDAVGPDEIRSDAVGSDEVAAGAVGSSELAPGSVKAGELAAVIHRQAVESIATGANGAISVNCLPNEKVLGGGGQAGHYGVEMTGSRPTTNGWVFHARNNTPGDSTIRAYALCLAS